ncbi:MAG: hypothetical protein JWM80_3068 [Cyanobacteria bacterium RYN_339]|nr:hypothetical protein [Cyanobacteria bacterium RYN_339]
MRRSIALVGLLLVACQPKAVVAPVVHASVRPAAASPTPAAAKASPLLGRPAGDVQVLSGVVKLDAGYLVGRSGIISNDGASLITQYGEGLITNDGGSLITNDGGSLMTGGNSGTLITNDGGSIISNDGASVLAVAAGAIISNDGASIISNDGASLAVRGGNLVVPNGQALITNGGGSLMTVGNSGTLITNDGGSLHLLAAAGPAPGTELPAAGMWLGAVSLATGKPVPVGVDAQGKPAYLVTTDLAGGFKLYLAPDVRQTVRLVARVPRSTNPRLRLQWAVEPAHGQDLALDQARAQATSALRVALLARVGNLVLTDDGTQTFSASFGKAYAPLLAGSVTALEALRKTASDNGYAKLAPSHRSRAVQAAVDALVADLTLPADDLDALTRGFATLQQAAAKRLAAADGRHDLETRPWALEADVRRAAAGLPAVAFPKSSDVGVFAIAEYLGSNDEARLGLLARLAIDLGLERAVADDMVAAYKRILVALAQKLLGLDPGATAGEELARVQQALQQAIVAEAAGPPGTAFSQGPAPAAVPVAGKSEVVVTTAVATEDGLGAEQFGGPRHLLFDREGRLILTLAAGVIGRVDLTGTDHHVVAIAGTRYAGTNLDGPGALATFRDLRGMALDAQGHLFVAEQATPDDASVIRMIDLGDPAFPVSTIAGKYNDAGLAVGEGKLARFQAVEWLQIDPNGDLIIPDSGHNRLCKLDLHDPKHTVTILAGTGVVSALDGPAAQATFRNPCSVAFTADGLMLIADAGNDRIRALAADGTVRTVAGRDGTGLQDGYWASATFKKPSSVLALAGGDFLVGDTFNMRLRRLRLDTRALGATVWTLGGSDVLTSGPPGMAQDAHGDVYLADLDGKRVRKLVLP